MGPTCVHYEKSRFFILCKIISDLKLLFFRLPCCHLWRTEHIAAHLCRRHLPSYHDNCSLNQASVHGSPLARGCWAWNINLALFGRRFEAWKDIEGADISVSNRCHLCLPRLFYPLHGEDRHCQGEFSSFSVFLLDWFHNRAKHGYANFLFSGAFQMMYG